MKKPNLKLPKPPEVSEREENTHLRFPEEEDIQTLEGMGELPLNEPVIIPGHREPIKDHTIQQFGELVREGKDSVEAARELGTTVRELLSDSYIRTRMKNIVAEYYPPNPAARQAFLEAALNKLVLDNLESDLPEDKKIALEAVKVGLQKGKEEVSAAGKTNLNISVDLNELLKDISFDEKDNTG